MKAIFGFSASKNIKTAKTVQKVFDGSQNAGLCNQLAKDYTGRVLSGCALPQHGRCRYVRHVVTLVRVVGTRDGTHPRRVVVVGGDSIRNMGRVMDRATVRVVGAQIWVQACGIHLGLGNENCNQHNLQCKTPSLSGLSTRFIK